MPADVKEDASVGGSAVPSIQDGTEKSVTVGTSSGSRGSSSIISGDTISAEFISAELKSPNSDDSGSAEFLSDEIMSGDTNGADGGHGRGE